MVIEWLKFRVASQAREKFIQKDSEIWTPVLANQSGFLGKEVWINPAASDQVVFVIRWQTREQWKSVPEEILLATEQKFAQSLGKVTYKMIETAEYQVRRFPEVAQ